MSEALLACYLAEQGLTFEYEPDVDGLAKHPDYRITFCGQELFLEVKEFTPGPHEPHPKCGGAYLPLPGIREKINRASRQFKEFKEWPCSLVLYNPGHPRIDIHEPRTIFEAMLGNSGVSYAVDTTTGRLLTPPQDIFEGDAKMFRDRNTTISAIIVLEEYLRGYRRGRVDEQKGWTANPTLDVAPTDHALLTLLRVTRYDNPFARKLLPPSLFHGAADETWAATPLAETSQGTEMGFARTFVGPLAHRILKDGPYALRDEEET